MLFSQTAPPNMAKQNENTILKSHGKLKTELRENWLKDVRLPVLTDDCDSSVNSNFRSAVKPVSVNCPAEAELCFLLEAAKDSEQRVLALRSWVGSLCPGGADL